MSAAEWFRIANVFVLPGWILLIAAPRWRWTQTIASLLIPAVLAVSYIWVLAAHWGEASGGGFSTLEEVRRLFANDWLLLGGWIHYLAFDLWIGSWQSRDCLERKIALLLVAPCLVLTFLFGPAGWLCYQALRRTRGRNI
jgi:hypothetical protein